MTAGRSPVAWIVRIVIAVSAVVVVLLGAGMVEVLMTNEESAKRHIQAVFVDVSRKRGFNPDDFEGPVLDRKTFWHYDFHWSDMKNEREALGALQFFPIQSEIWIFPKKQ